MKKKYDQKIEGTLQIYWDLIKLKSLLRQGWLKKGIKEELCESVADHSFGTAVLALFLCPPQLNKQKTVEMALLHETGEAITGDITPHDGISEKEKNQLETEAVKKIFSNLDDSDYWLNLWLDFEEGRTDEGRFVKQLDKLEMAFQAKLYNKLTKNDMSDFYSSANKLIKDSKLQELLEEIAE
jgi:putative hydrolase of HD superfamily